jgi:sugar O-acyltransferase (sialic acid O-acetyltransferase NeuD family)
MNSPLFGLVGTGGCAREVMPHFRYSIQRIKGSMCVPDIIHNCVFVDLRSKPDLNRTQVMAEADYLAHSGKKFFNIAISNGQLRQDISQKYREFDCEIFGVIASSSIIGDGCEVGEGAVICDYCIVGANVKIGRFFQMNVCSYLAHDCVVGNYVTFAPRVTCNGNIMIDDGVYIGAGAIIRQGNPDAPLRIGAGAVVGMGAVVLHDIPPGATVIGNPARILCK